jgi:hypothetical protein
MQYPVSAFYFIALATARLPDSLDNDWLRLALTLHHSTLSIIAAAPVHHSLFIALATFTYNLFCISRLWTAPSTWTPAHLLLAVFLSVCCPFLYFAHWGPTAVVLFCSLAAFLAVKYLPVWAPLIINLLLALFYAAVAAVVAPPAHHP